MGMRIMWHVTTRTALPLILKDGLQPQVGPRSQEAGDNSPALYFFPILEVLEEGVVNWLGDEFAEDEELIFLKVSLPAHIAAHSCNSAVFEIIVREPIPPENIISCFNENMQPMSIEENKDVLS